jgi:arabinoxylan arabinofuranohydrolase
MKKKLLFLLSMGFTIVAIAQNPIIQTRFTADPAPMVYKGTVFLYTSHDEDNAKPGMGKFLMKDWLLYTSVDMVNWTDHGAVATLKDFKWGRQDNGAWAPQCIERNGKFYLYCPVQGSGIGVMVSDSPYGPFKDPLGKKLLQDDHVWNDIDPTVFIDDDGQAYLYWGNPSLWYVKLNKDMISYSGDVKKVPGIEKDKGQTNPDNYHYQEAPWFYKRNGHYYLAYASTCCPEGIGYAMSDSPTGPWVYKGMIMDGAPISSGNHPGIIDYKGSSYVFGFNYTLNYAITSEHHERRSVCLEKLTYNTDGTIQKLPFWSTKGTDQVGVLNPFIRTEAETINWEVGVKTVKDSVAGVFVTGINNNDYIKVRGADFRKGAKSFEANASSGASGGDIEIHIDSLNGVMLGSCKIGNTGGWQKWKIHKCSVDRVAGVHDVYFVFKGGTDFLFNFNWWKFS